MRIKIKKNPTVVGGSMYADSYRKRINESSGKWLKVETEHLFADQFNCENENPSKYDYGMRVNISLVEKIEDDVRKNAAKCLYCGICVLDVPNDKILTHCSKCLDKYGADVDGLIVLDRIRPLLSIIKGKIEVVYPNKQVFKETTPEGVVHKYKKAIGFPLKNR